MRESLPRRRSRRSSTSNATFKRHEPGHMYGIDPDHNRGYIHVFYNEFESILYAVVNLSPQPEA